MGVERSHDLRLLTDGGIGDAGVQFFRLRQGGEWAG